MADVRSHLSQAEHNRELANRLISDAKLVYRDWAVITAFYSALHYVEAEGAKGGCHLHSHQDRLDHVRHEFYSYFPIIRAFEALHRASFMLRYLEYQNNEYQPCGQWMDDQDVKDHVLIDLEDIRKHVLKQVSVR
ncbi:MAG: hypothetical protein ACOYEQ_02315 [Bacillota bacterium]|jgi:hypothetical protein